VHPAAGGTASFARNNTEYRADQMFRTLKAARLDNSVEVEMRALARVEKLIIDDFALQAVDPTETSDFYELIVERHQRTSTILTSTGTPVSGSRP
jgi:DNA replication protein DnaC